MSGYPGGNAPQWPPQQNPPYNAPVPPTAMSYPGQPGAVQPGPFPGYPQLPQQGFNPNYGFPPNYGYPSQPGVPNVPMSAYPGVNPTAPPYAFGQPSVNQFPASIGGVEWVTTNPRDAAGLSDRAVVAGYEGYDNSPLWVIRAQFEGDLVPGKLAIKHHAAYVPWNGKENAVSNIQVCCARADRVRWVPSSNGAVPNGAIPGGHTSSGETLYIGRAKQQGSLTPGKVHPSHTAMYMSFAGKEVSHKTYEILVAV